MRSVKVLEPERSISYWIGFYHLNHDFSIALKDAGYHIIEELGRDWHERPELLTEVLREIACDAEERGRLIRGLNDAEAFYLNHRQQQQEMKEKHEEEERKEL